MQLQGQVGLQLNGDGVANDLRTGRTGELIASELQGRFYENTYRNATFSTGTAGLVALAAATIALTTSCQPIVGVWNPLNSPVNLVILQIGLTALLNNVTATGPGAFVLAASTGNGGLSAGLAPFNRKTLSSNGSQAKAFNPSTASLLTGLSNNLLIFEALEFASPTALATTTVAASTPTPNQGWTINLDGSLIVPPGGVLALLNTTSTTTTSVAARMVWAEVAV